MNIDRKKFDHLISNLERSSSKKSIFNYKSGRKAFLSLGKGNIREWLETLLPNTRLILEPKIVGSNIGLQYINGKLNKAINDNSRDITEKIKTLSSVPNFIPIKHRLEIRGVVYINENKSNKKIITEFKSSKTDSTKQNEFNFCAFQIFHCKINQFQALKELNNLNFQIPETQFTNFISDIDIYIKCWKEGKLFQHYPTNGIVLKINSRKLQKNLGDNNLSRNWAYAIK